MLKLGIQLKEVGDTLNLELIDPTKKQLEAATENEKTTAQILKDVFNKKLVDLIMEHESTKIEK
jgi:hypothetical protein